MPRVMRAFGIARTWRFSIANSSNAHAPREIARGQISRPAGRFARETMPTTWASFVSGGLRRDLRSIRRSSRDNNDAAGRRMHRRDFLILCDSSYGNGDFVDDGIRGWLNLSCDSPLSRHVFIFIIYFFFLPCEILRNIGRDCRASDAARASENSRKIRWQHYRVRDKRSVLFRQTCVSLH